MTEIPKGIKTIGYTNDGLVFIQIVTVYEDQPLETTLQFDPENAVNLCKCIMQATLKARSVKEVPN